MRLLQAEAREEGDLVILPQLDYYIRAPLKLILMLQWLVAHSGGPSYVGKQDDDFCLRTDVMRSLIARGNLKSSFVYGGGEFFRTAAYWIQKGFDGSFAPYYSGHAYFLSRPLAEGILSRDDLPYYGVETRCSEDCVLGRWVRQFQERRNVQVFYLGGGMIVDRVRPRGISRLQGWGQHSRTNSSSSGGHRMLAGSSRRR